MRKIIAAILAVAVLVTSVPAMENRDSDHFSCAPSLEKWSLSLFSQLAPGSRFDRSNSAKPAAGGMRLGEEGVDKIKQEFPEYANLVAKLAQPNLLGPQALRTARRNVGGKAFEYTLEHIVDIPRFISTFRVLSKPCYINLEILQTVFGTDSNEFLCAFERLSSTQNLALFQRAFRRLGRTPIGRERLRKAFIQSPDDLVSALILAGKHIEELDRYIRTDGSIDLNQLLADTQLRLVFNNYEAASFNATRGFLETLKIDPQHILIGYSCEANETQACERFPDLPLIQKPRPHPQWLVIHFGNRFGSVSRGILGLGKIDFGSAGWFGVPYVPYKHLFSRKSHQEIQQTRSDLRQSMQLTEERKVIVAASLSSGEIEPILKAYAKFPRSQRPLLIVGVAYPNTYPNTTLKDKLTGNGFRAAERNSPHEGLAAFNQLDIVILNTKGELIKLLAAADLAVVGRDRNLFEPAALGVPILYFGGSWHYNNFTKNLLVKHRGALKISVAGLYKQIKQLLHDPTQLVHGADKAIKILHEEVASVRATIDTLFVSAGILEQVSGASLKEGHLRGSMAERRAP